MWARICGYEIAYVAECVRRRRGGKSGKGYSKHL